MHAFQRIRTLAATLFGALLLFVLCAGVANAGTVTNTAQASWVDAGLNQTTTSNTVRFDVVVPTVTLETLRPTFGGSSLAITAPQCGGSALPIAGIGGGSGALAASQTTTLNPGEVLVFQLVSPLSNTNPAAIDSVTATLVTTRGDRETVTVFETAPNSGIFVGAIPTIGIPPTPIQGDCRLSVVAGDVVSISIQGPNNPAPIATSQVTILADPYGLVFDSEDGHPVSGATVSLVDALTGAPAQVFGDDGVTPWPSTMVSGVPVTDGAGVSHPMAPGEYRFPLVPLGQYRIIVTPPAPYTAPSVATPAQLAGLTRPDGNPMLIVPASYAQALVLASAAPVRVDVPVDRPAQALVLTKDVSRQTAEPGDALFYTLHVTNTDTVGAKRQVVLTDISSPWLRLRPDSIRIDGAPAAAAATVSPDGHTITLALGDFAPGVSHTVTYAMTVRADAPPGQALNRADVADSRGLHTIASAAVKIERETIAGRMTIIGRIVDGGCAPDQPHNGIPGVRVMLEDGSFALTDRDGRYHFEGVVPGTHVVQAAGETLPQGGTFADCTRSTRSAGSANSRFVTGQGGSLAVVDFAANLAPGASIAPAAAAPLAKPATDREAAGGDIDWLALGDGPTDFIFPAPDHNPRSPAVRVAIRHRKGETVELKVDGKPVDPVAFDGAKISPWGFAVSVWRGIPLSGEETRLTATVRDGAGTVVASLARNVHFVSTPARVEWVRERSRLLADGANRPVLAIRVLDRLGRPVHAGLTGTFTINAPYESAAELDALQTRQLSGLDRAAPTWTVKGDDGIALIELAPTMVSGPLHLDFVFTDGTISRKQTLDSWVVPGDQKWTLVGLAEGTVGARSVATNMERKGRFDSDLGDNARVAFYAKGRVLGRYLLTLAYDSAKDKNDQRLLGAIDPNAYYTVFADGSDRRFDAASREKLYVRIEAATFYALYGDFVTGFDQTLLARYQRTLTGAKAEGRFGKLHVQGFAAKSGDLHRRDEIQGGGISGPYRLSSRDIIANSESVVIETRDRFRSELVIERKPLTRFIDYDIDLLSGTITFKEPVLSRDALLNPQFIVIDYDVAQASGGRLNAGLRADVTVADGKLRLGATVLSDTASADGARATLGAADVKAQLGNQTELRGEVALSEAAGKQAQAWLVEVEHHDGNLDLLGYIHSVEDGFAPGQLNGAEHGRRKVGLDARYRFTDALSVVGSAWYDDSLTDATKRKAMELSTVYRTRTTEARLGVTHFSDTRQDGSDASSTVLDGAVSHRMLDNKLEVSAAASVGLGTTGSVDLPSRYRFGLKYALTHSVKLTGTYEIAEGDAVRARTAQAGLEVSPWEGARILGSLGQQSVAENGKRSFAAFGLSQSLALGKSITVDATIDSSRTLGSFDAAKLIDPAHPASSGGQLNDSGALVEDFTALTLGATWRHDKWSATVRGEYRDGELANRKGLTFGAIRQLGDGSAVGAGFTWTHADGLGGASSDVFDGAVSAAHRPANSALAFLTKLEFRSDAVTGAVAGEAGPAGRTALTVTGDALSRRLIGSLSINWSPRSKDDGALVQRHEVALFGAVRHSFDRVEGFDLGGTTLLGGVDARIGLGDHFDLGAVATVKHSVTDKTTVFAIGPQIGISPAKDVLFTLGYNISGFRDRDFGATRTTNKGVFASVKMKFDAGVLDFLGLSRR